MDIWSIIPKITSPLAVICFCVYVFYLFKQSSDKKEAKALKVGDSQAQRDAVDKIFREYPDFKIDPISDPDGALQIAKQIMVNKLSKYQKSLNFLLIFSAIFAFTFLMSLGISNNNILKELISNNNKSWAEKSTISNGHNPYSLLSVMCHIQLKDSVNVEHKLIRKAYFRYFYILKATRDISIDEDVFEEQYLTNNARIIPWAGTENQVIESISDHRYWVKFSAKKNQVLTIATGADYVYDQLDSNNGSTGCFGNLNLSPTDWFTCYPNTNDYIDHLTLIVEGQNFSVNLLPSATYRKSANGMISNGEAICKVFSDNKKCTLEANWSEIGPGECLGLRVGCTHLNIHFN